MSEHDPYTDSGRGDQYSRRFPRGHGAVVAFVAAILVIGAIIVTSAFVRRSGEPVAATQPPHSQGSTGQGESIP